MKLTVSQSNYLHYRKQAHRPARCTVTHLPPKGYAFSLKTNKQNKTKKATHKKRGDIRTVHTTV